jgi:hypothetical protein
MRRKKSSQLGQVNFNMLYLFYSLKSYNTLGKVQRRVEILQNSTIYQELEVKEHFKDFAKMTNKIKN